jgi:hypothetical protein
VTSCRIRKQNKRDVPDVPVPRKSAGAFTVGGKLGGHVFIIDSAEKVPFVASLPLFLAPKTQVVWPFLGVVQRNPLFIILQRMSQAVQVLGELAILGRVTRDRAAAHCHSRGNETVSGTFLLLASKGVTLDATGSPSASERFIAVDSPPRRHPECDKRLPPSSASYYHLCKSCFPAQNSLAKMT